MKWLRLKRHLSVLLCLAMVMSMATVLPAPGQAAPVEVEVGSVLPADDALIRSDNPDTNYNICSNCASNTNNRGLWNISSSNSEKKYAFFKFDVSTVSDNTYKYYLQVAAKQGTSETNVTFNVLGYPDNAWNEQTVTWNNPAKDFAQAVAIGTYTVSTTTTSLYTVDVTEYVRSRLADGVVTLIVTDSSTAGKSTNLYSKESSSQPKPKLIAKRIPLDDTAPPVWPNGSQLKSTNLGADFVHLSWPPAADDNAVTNYRIYKNDTVAATVYGRSTYKLAGLTPATAYHFKVEAGDVAGNYSAVPLSYNTVTLSAPVPPLPVIEVNASSNDGNVESNMLDNNMFSRWSASGDGQFADFDLGEVKRVGYIGIAFYKGNERTTNIDIQTSVDAVTWIHHFSGNSSGTNDNMEAFDIADSDARFIRIVGHGNSINTFTSITDVMVYPPYLTADTPVAVVPNIIPKPPEGTLPFTKPGLTNPDGTEHPVHTPNPVTGQTINVLNYGADPADNNTDDRVAVQNAINAAQAGDEVFLPNGVYNLLSSPDGFVNLKLKTGVNLRGESEAGTVLKSSLDNVKNSSVVKSSAQNNILISNLTVSSTWDRTFTTEHTTNNPEAGGPDNGITVANTGETPSYNVTVEQVTVERFRRIGVRIENSRDVVVRSVTFRNATDLGGGGAGYGTSIQGMPKVDRLGFDNDTYWNLVENSRFEGPYLRHGSLIQYVAHNNVLRNNKYIRTKLDSIDLHGELEYLNEVHGNEITDILTGGGVGLGNTGGTAPSNHSKSGPNNYIHDNVIRNSREGIIVTMGTPDTIIENNLIENTTEVTNGAGINILNGPGTVIRNNTIRNNTADNYWGILLEHDFGDRNANNVGQGDPDNVQILNNTVTGNANGIQLQAGTNITVRDNILDNAGTNYLKADGVTATEVWIEDNNNLKSLNVSGGSLTPAFDKHVTHYTVQVASNITGISITPAVEYDQAVLKINGGSAVSGAVYGPVPLTAGDNPIDITVQSVSGLEKTYRVTVTRQTSGNADLSGLVLSAGTLSPAFSGEVTQYTASVAYGMREISVTPALADNQAQVTVNGVPATAGSAFGPIALQVGENTITIVVTAGDQTSKTYTVKIRRASNNNRSSSGGSSGATASSGATGSAVSPDAPSPSGAADGLVPSEIKQADGKQIAVAKADAQTVEAAINNQGPGPVKLTVETEDNVSQVELILTDQALQKLKESSVPWVAVDTRLGAYRVPLKLLDLTPYAGQLGAGAGAGQLQLKMTITRNEAASLQAEASGMNVIEAVEFTLQAMTEDGNAVEITEFQQYVPRSIKTDAVFNERNLAVVRVAADPSGLTYEPVPFTVTAGEVTVYSRSNSTYMLLENNAAFTDTSNHWAKDSIERMANKRIVQGVTEVEFHPDRAVTRAELAALLTRTLGLGLQEAASADAAFHDVTEQEWYYTAVAIAAKAGLITGYEDGTFRPNQTVTRQETAVMIDRALQFAGSNEQPPAALPGFADQDQIKSWAQDAVKRLYGNKLMEGISGSAFAPEEEATRAQCAVILLRLLQEMNFSK